MSPSERQRRSSDRTARTPAVAPPRRSYVLVLAAVLVAATGWWLIDWYLHAVPTRDDAPSWSPDGGSIVFASERRGVVDLFVIDDQGKNERQITHTPVAEGAPAFAPNGRQIAFESPFDGNPEIAIVDVNGANLRRLTRHPARDLAPAWSPDGKIVFLSDRDARPRFEAYRMNPDGTGVERLAGKALDGAPQVSPDGRWLAVHIANDVHLLDLPSKALFRLTHDPANGQQPTWSSTGRQLAFVSWRNGSRELFTMNADGSDQQRVVEMPRGHAVRPRWSPNGDRLVFVHFPGAMPSDAEASRAEKLIYLAELGSGKVTRLSR